jgi:uncharacterized protein (TIGR03437 family)
MFKLRNYSAIGILALLSPIAALADINDTKTLAAGTALSLDNDTTASSGGDILWTGTQITFQGSAKGGSLSALGLSGASGFASVTQTILQAVASLATTAPIPAANLTVGTVLGVATNAGNAAKLLVTAASGTSITLQFTTFGATAGGGGTGGGAPTITKILNNYSLIPAGFVNSNVAPSTLFVAMGSNMSDPPPASGLSLNTTAAPGLPTTSAGASATITSGGKTFPVPLYYASPTQIAGVIPAAVPTGPATMTVTYKSQTSAAFSFNVVAQALGLGTYNGVTIATDAVTGVLVDYTHTAKPGGTYVFWGSGGGADTADSDSVYTTSPHSVNQANTQFYFGSTQGTVLYSGSSGFPGLMQINVTIPTNVTTGCGVITAAIVNGVPSNFGPIPIDGSGICHDSIYGISGTDLSNLGNQGTVRSGSLFVGQLVSPAPGGTNNIADANFSSTTGGSFSGGVPITVGSCSVLESISGSTTTATSTPLDAGTISLSGPSVSTTLQSITKGTYIAQLSSITAGGTYTFTGGGGVDVGSFTGSLTMPNPLLTLTNQTALATVTRSSGIQVNWNGGAAGTYVIITGSSSNSAGASGSFTCFAPQSAGGFLVPAFVASVLPAGSGTLLIENSTLPAKFTAPKLDQGFAFGFTGTQINAIYQ